MLHSIILLPYLEQKYGIALLAYFCCQKINGNVDDKSFWAGSSNASLGLCDARGGVTSCIVDPLQNSSGVFRVSFVLLVELEEKLWLWLLPTYSRSRKPRD